MERRVVFGDDASAASDTVWLWLSNHQWDGWQVDVVHAEMPDIRHLPVPHELTELRPWDPPHPRTAFAEAGFGPVRHLTAVGDPRVVLGACRDARLLAVGPRGPGLLKALHLGSTAEWLLQRPPAPLVIVKSARRVRTVLLGMDGSADSWCALKALTGLPWVAEVEVTILGARDGRADVPAALDAAAAELQPRVGSVKTRLAGAPATVAMYEVLDHDETDLVVLGTRGHTGIRHLTVGSTASQVAQAARCSVLVATERPTDDEQSAR